MGKMKALPYVVLVLMTVLSFTNLFGLNISSACIFLGVIFFFISVKLEKIPMKESGLNIASLGKDLKNKQIWLWLILPILVDTICILLSKLFLPEYIEFETNRAGAFVTVELSISSILLFFVFALGEEIAWRAFFQNKVSKMIPFLPSLLITSFLFTLGHYSEGDLKIVVFGLVFTFINSCLYGIIFYKTKNAWVSAIAHYMANMFEVTVYVLMK